MPRKNGTKCHSSIEQNQESEPTLEVFLDVVEESTVLKETEGSSNTPSKTADFIERRSGRRKRKDDDVMMGNTEYAISQVVRGDFQHISNEGLREEPPGKIKSASVTLFDPVQRESIIQYTKKKSISQASRRFKVPSATIKKWMNSLEDSSMLTKSKFNSPGQGRKLSYLQDTDDRIAVHIRDMVASGEKVSMHYICSYAKTIIRAENPSFIASTGWAQRFLVRHSIDLGIQRLSKKKSCTSPESGRGRPLSYSQATDKAIADYVRGRLADGQHLTNAELRRYAKEEICKENPNFTGSASWAQNFFLRNKIALQSFPSVPFSGSSPSSMSPRLSPPSSSSSPHVSMSPSLSDASLVASEITSTSCPSGPIYRDTSIGSLENVVDDPMKTALTLLTGDNIDLTVLSTTQVAALQNSLSEFTHDSVSLVDLLSTNGSSSTHQGEEGSRDGEERNGGATLIASGLESPSSGNVYLNLGDGGEGFSSGLTGLATTQVNPTTQVPSQPTMTSARHISEVVAQGSRPLSYAKETDQTLADWVQAQQAEGKRVTFASLRSFAKQLIASENPSFNASVGWVTPFLLRHNLDLSINRKVKASRKGTPRKVASQDTPQDQEEQDVYVEPERMAEKHMEENSSGEAQLELQDSSSSTTTITPEMLASAIATTFAEAIMAQQQQKKEQQEQKQEQQQQQEAVVLEYPPSQPEEPILIEHHHVHSSPERLSLQHSVASPTHQQEGAAMVSLHSLVGSEQEFVSKGESRPSTNLHSDRTRTRHTLAEKLEVVQLMKEHGVAAHYVCRMLGIANSTFAGWTKLVQQKGAELQALSTNKKRANVSGQGRPLSYSREKDEQIAQWVKDQQQLGMLVSPSDLSKHATYVISQENPNFTASSGWQQKFLQRHSLQPWMQKSGSSPCSTQGEERVSIIHSAVVEDPQNIPVAVQTEEVTSNEFSMSFSDKAYSDALDEEIVAWVRKKKASKAGPSVQMLCKKAEEVICKEVPSFIATLGWAFKFLHHHFIMLDPKPSANASSTVLIEGNRKRASRDRDYSGVEVADSSSKYLHTPKKVRQMDNSVPEVASIAAVATSAVAVNDSASAFADITVSPSTGNLCEALLALSNQTVIGEGEVALQTAMQNLQNAMQQALKQQQLQLQQQQKQGQQQHHQQSPPQQQTNKQPDEESDEQQHKALTPESTLAPLTVVNGTPNRSTRKTKLASFSGNNDSDVGGAAAGGGVGSVGGSGGNDNVGGGGGGTPYNNYFGKPAREFSPEEKEEVVRYANATTLLKAALKYGVAAPTVWRWRVELKLHQPKYTAMQKKYIIKFAETNSLKEASHRYGITSKTIQNWRKALQSEGDTVPLSGPASEEVPLVSHPGDQMLESSPPLPKVASSHDAEVVAYDSQNFQFIVDGGEVCDTGGRGDHDMAEQPSTTSLRMDSVPLEVTNEVDIENVGMEYDVISSEGHAAKPRCTLREKMMILQYAIDHSVREASQKYGISPGTLYYWKKMGMSTPGGGTGGGSPQTGTPPAATAITLGQAPVGNTPLMVLRTLNDDPRNVMSVYPGTSSLLEQIQVATSRDSSRGGQQGRSEKIGDEQYLSAASDVHIVSTSLSGTDLSLLHAVSALLNSSGRSAVTDNGNTDLSARPRSQALMARNNSSSGGISSPTEVLVAPLQVATEEVATSVEEKEIVETNTNCSVSTTVDQAVAVTMESVVVVEVEPQSGEEPEPETVAITDKNMLEIETVTNAHVTEEMEQEVEQDMEQEVEQGVGTEPKIELDRK